MDARRTTQLKYVQLLVRIYKRRRRRLELSLGVPFPDKILEIPKKPKNIARIALNIKTYLLLNPNISYGTAALSVFSILYPTFLQLIT